MIDLGRITIHDDESSTHARTKLFGLLRALKAGEVVSTRVATGVSELARSYIGTRREAACTVSLDRLETGVTLQVALEGAGKPPNTAPLEAATQNVRVEGVEPHTIIARLPLPIESHTVTPAFIELQRERVQRRSRRELVADLREKNEQLEAYNEALEATVAERTAELRDANESMSRNLRAGADYVAAIIPPRTDGPIKIDWEYVPSSDLGGDTIGYHWISDDELAVYLIDVTGHGLASALLAVTVTNLLRSNALQGADMTKPGEVLESLNATFQSEQHGGKMFTMWYGVYTASTRRLVWDGAGHHPAMLLSPDGSDPAQLESSGPLIGAIPGLTFEHSTREIQPGSRLIISSDGAYEILRDSHLVWTLRAFNEFLAGLGGVPHGELSKRVLAKAVELRGSDQLDDDFSLIDVEFE